MNRALSRAVVDRREALGLIQEQVWQAAGFKKSSYQAREQSARNWTPDDLKAVAAVLQTTGAELWAAAELIYAQRVPPAPDRAAQELRAALGFE